MSLFTRLFAPFRVKGSEPSRVIYMDSPLTIRPSHISALVEALQDGSRSHYVAVYVNGRPLDAYAQMNVSEALHRATSIEPVRSVSLHNGDVDVWLAWAASAQAKTPDLNSLGTLWRVQQVLDGARWKFGDFLVRYWAAFVAVLMAILVILFTLNVTPVAQRDAIAATASVGVAVILFMAGLIATTRRVRLDIPSPNRKNSGGFTDFLFQAFFYPAAALLLTALLPLVVAWWSTLTNVPVPTSTP